jgi:hypothetical protein
MSTSTSESESTSARVKTLIIRSKPKAVNGYPNSRLSFGNTQSLRKQSIQVGFANPVVLNWELEVKAARRPWQRCVGCTRLLLDCEKRERTDLARQRLSIPQSLLLLIKLPFQSGLIVNCYPKPRWPALHPRLWDDDPVSYQRESTAGPVLVDFASRTDPVLTGP